MIPSQKQNSVKLQTNKDQFQNEQYYPVVVSNEMSSFENMSCLHWTSETLSVQNLQPGKFQDQMVGIKHTHFCLQQNKHFTSNNEYSV